MKINIIFSDVEKAVKACNERYRSTYCVLSQAAERLTQKRISSAFSSYDSIVFTDNTVLDPVDPSRVKRVTEYFDNHYRFKSAEEIWSYYEAQDLLELEFNYDKLPT